MYAALEAARAGADVILADRSLIGRGGATVMAQMTVAAALGEQTPDSWEYHLADTIAAGRGLCDERLAALLCEDGPRRIREMDSWKVGWAREDGHIKQAQAPGHDRPRCVYVDFLSTGPAVSRTLRTRLNDASGIRRIGDLLIVDITIRDGEACGATALHDGADDVAQSSNPDALRRLLPDVPLFAFPFVPAVDDLSMLASTAQMAGLDALLLPPDPTILQGRGTLRLQPSRTS